MLTENYLLPDPSSLLRCIHVHLYTSTQARTRASPLLHLDQCVEPLTASLGRLATTRHRPRRRDQLTLDSDDLVTCTLLRVRNLGGRVEIRCNESVAQRKVECGAKLVVFHSNEIKQTLGASRRFERLRQLRLEVNLNTQENEDIIEKLLVLRQLCAPKNGLHKAMFSSYYSDVMCNGVTMWHSRI